MQMPTNRFLFLAASGLAMVTSFQNVRAAEATDDVRHLTIGAVKVREITDEVAPLDERDLPLPPAGGPVDEADLILDKIIHMGKKVWAIIAANKPVVNVRTDSASALPEGARGWESLEGWQLPRARIFRITWENLYGIEVVNFSFRVLYTYGGNVNGKGRYLTRVTIVPRELSVAWGYTFNADATVPSVVNTGTRRDPVAGMELMLKWSVDTVMKHNEGTASFFVQGDGQFTDLTDGNPAR
jgi:hypothetical protein